MGVPNTSPPCEPALRATRRRRAPTTTMTTGGLRNSLVLSVRLRVERGNDGCMQLAALALFGHPCFRTCQRMQPHLAKESALVDNAHVSTPALIPTAGHCPTIDDNTALSFPGGLALTVAPPADHTSAAGASSRLTLAGFLNIPQPSSWRLYPIHPTRASELQNVPAGATSPTRCPPARSANTCQADRAAGDDTWMTRAKRHPSEEQARAATRT